MTDENTFSMLDSYGDLTNRKYTSLLNECKVVASGNDCILITSDMSSIVNRINSEKMNKELYVFMRDILHTDKILFAITNEEFVEATKTFREKMHTGELPDPIQITKYEEDTSEETSTIDKVKQLFGEENVKVV